MSNFDDRTTGLMPGTKLWIREDTTSLPQKGDAVFSLWGDKNQQVAGDNWEVTGKDLEKIETLIALTYVHLQNHIDGSEDSAELARNLLLAKTKVEKI